MPTRYTPRQMLEKLISFPTVSRDSNMDLINFVRAYLGEYGIESRLVPNEDGSKANLYASVGPAVPGGVVLSGHTDVVPVDGQEWTTDPFRLVERDGLLVGRGTADMKGFIAIGLALVPDMLAAGIKKPIHFALSYDEEVGCIGAPYMIEHMVANLPRPRAVIVGEPTSMKVVTEHKGSISFHTHVSGHSVHSAYVDRGVSAVVTGARLVTFLDDMMQENIARTDPQNPFDPPFTTVHTGLIEGGTAPNIVAKDCRFTTDIRSISDDDPEAYFHRFQAHIKDTVEPAMRQVVPETGIDLTNYRYVPGLKRESDGEAERLSRQITGDNSTNVVSYGTEAGHFQSADYSVVVCGPGSIDQAHKPDEFVSVDQYNAGVNFVERLIKQLI